MTFKLYDEEDNEVFYSNSIKNITVLLMEIVSNTIVSIYSINNQKRLTLTPINLLNSFEILQTKVISKPKTTAVISVFSKSIQIPDENNYFSNQLYNFTIKLDFRECYVGEIFSSITGSCDPCPPNFYSFNNNDISCKLCLEGLNCTGGNKTNVLPNYWRENIYTENILKCYETNFCAGGNGSGNSNCNIGYIGPLCKSCDTASIFWSNSFSKINSSICEVCASSYHYYIVLLFLSLQIFFYMGLSIKGMLDNLKVSLAWEVVKLVSRYSMIPKVVNEGGFYIKIYMTYLQIILIITTFKMPLPDWVEDSLSFSGDSLKYQSNLLDCLFFSTEFSLIPNVYLKLILSLITPFVYFFIFSIFYLIIVRNMQLKRKYQLLYAVAIFTFLYFQPSIIRKIMTTISCIEIRNKLYIKADLMMECNSNTYFFYVTCLALPAILIWGLITPLTILRELYIKKKKLKQIPIKVKFGYLYLEYRLFYWEFIKMFEKILLIVSVEYYDSENNIKGLLVLLIIGIYYISALKAKPYIKKFQNSIDKLTTIVCFVSIFFIIFIYQQSSSQIKILGYVVIGLLNLFYNFLMIRLIINSFLFKRRDRIEEFQKRIIKVCRCLKLCFWDFGKKIKTLEKWMLARRLVARYLREKERRKFFDEINENYNALHDLSLLNYDPMNVGIKRKLKLKKKNTEIFLENRKKILLDTDSCRLNSINSDDNVISTHKSRKDQKKILKEQIGLKNFLEDTLKKIRINDE